MMRRIKKLIKLPLVLSARAYFRIRQFYPIWFYLLNQKPRKLFRENPPELNEAQKKIVQELKESGIARVHLDELFPGENLLARLESYTQGLLAQGEVKTGKTFLKNLWEAESLLDLSNPFVEFSLSPEVLNVINAYLEMYANFYTISLNITMPVSEGEKAIASQRWHRDPEDKKMLKMFLYLNEVDADSGPFTYIPYSKYGLRWGKIFPQRPPRGFYPEPGEVEKMIPESAVKHMTGKAGTLIFCDTTGLHKGGYASKKERIMFTAGYRSKASAWREQFKYPKDFEQALKKVHLSPAAGYALLPNRDFLTTRLLYWVKRNK